ncbi:MAG TPA: glutamate racemase [Lachnospiraceae bacterium]|nr:glutamate racemase [Lachnospiraceae bacterium]
MAEIRTGQNEIRNRKRIHHVPLNRDAPIGVFDSGVGGLTVAREIMRQIPNEKIIYFGDTARVPYGNKSQETVTRFSKQIVRFLQTFQVKTIVVACNTASAYAMDALEQDCDIPIIGVVKPGARMAAEVTRNGRLGVIATEATISSRIYTQYIQELNPNVTIYGKACPLFVPLVEEGLLEDPVTDEIARRYLTELIDIDIDTLILGCTHYPLIRSTLSKIMGPNVTLVNPAYETARELRQMLEQMNLLNEDPPKLGSNRYQFYVSDKAEKFMTFANSIIKYGILSARTIHIEKY